MTVQRNVFRTLPPNYGELQTEEPGASGHKVWETLWGQLGSESSLGVAMLILEFHSSAFELLKRAPR